MNRHIGVTAMLEPIGRSLSSSNFMGASEVVSTANRCFVAIVVFLTNYFSR
jgi:hypothetical protein